MVDIKDLEKAVKEGKLDRREFISRMIALGVATTATSALWSGPAMAAQKKGGSLTTNG